MKSRIAAFMERPRYHRFDPETLASIPDENLEQAIADFVLDRASAERRDEMDVLSELNPSFSHVYATWITEAEVANGGFNQYFFNSTGRLAPDAADGYEALGAHERAKLVREAMGRVLDRGPELGAAWSPRTLEAFSASYDLDVFGDLDKAFYALDDVEDASSLRIAYVRAHAGDFVIG